MPPKTPKGAAAAKQQKKPDDEKREEALQAVVLADSYEEKFSPLTDDRPRCLLPLANTPLLDYTLHFLAHNGLQHVFVYCGAHADQVEEYLTTSRWKTPSPTSPFASLVCLRTPAASVGDALRDLDKRDLILGDFLLVHGDLVSNMLLEPVLLRHKARRERDRSAIMTMVLREGPRPNQRKHPRGRRSRRPRDHSPIFVLDPSNRCLHYEELGRGESKHVTVNPDILAANPELDIRTDLRDPRIDLCAPDVLSLWSDNFDYGAPRVSFLAGVLRDYELNGKTIHIDVASAGYAERVQDVRSYGAVTQDLLTCRVYPFAPDVNLGEGDEYRHYARNVYLEKGVHFEGVEWSSGKPEWLPNALIGHKDYPVRLKDSLQGQSAHNEGPRHIPQWTKRTSESRDTSSGPPSQNQSFSTEVRVIPSIGAERNTVIGRGTTIGNGGHIADSCIGRHCQIGRNVTLTHSHIWDGARIEDGATVTASIIGAGAAVAPNRQAEHLRVPTSTRVSEATPPIREAADAEMEDLLRPRETLSRSPSVSSLSSVSTLRSSSTSPPPVHRRTSSHASAADRPATPTSATALVPGSKLPSALAAGSGTANTTAAARASLLADMATSAQDGAVRAQSLETVRLELLGQRMASDADDALVRDALALGLIRAVWWLVEGSSPTNTPSTPTRAELPPDESAAATDDDEDAFEASTGGTDTTANVGPVPAKEAVARVYGAYGALLQKMGIFDYGQEEKSDQQAVLAALERECAARGEQGEGARVLLFALQRLYEADIVQEEGVLAWWQDGGGDTGGLRKLAAQFVQWLQEAESESDSGSE